MKRVALSVLILLILVPCTWLLIYKYESQKPIVNIALPSPYLKKSYEMSVNIEDKKTGLRQIMVSIMQQGKEKVLLQKEYESSPLLGLLSGEKQLSDAFIIPVESWKYGMVDGEAIIRVMVSDFSWRGWNKGNISYIEKRVVIDSKPPKVTILSKRHNIERGGSGLVIYKLYEGKVKSGVNVGDNFFPGYPGMFDDENIYVSFIALRYSQGPGTQISVIAEDLAGNATKRGFHHYIRDKKYKIDTLNISNRFLERKIPDFDVGNLQGSFQSEKNPLLKKFLYINEEVRKQNVDRILGILKDTEKQKHWNGKFLRLRGSAQRAGFADHRIYKHKGNEIDRAVHLGIDLAKTANANILAANSGKVIFSQSIGIFGNTIIIDHGFGVASLYSHLNQFSVNEGDMVNQGDLIGLTGLTGLAGGDHLHFSMIVHNVFVNPYEWWDKSWLKNNIDSKMDSVLQMKK